MFRTDVDDLGLFRGRQPGRPKPSYRPALERMEERMTPSTSPAPVHVDPAVTASFLQLSAVMIKHGNKVTRLANRLDNPGASLTDFRRLDRRIDIANNLIRLTNDIISSVTGEQMSDPYFAQAVSSLYASAQRLRQTVLYGLLMQQANDDRPSVSNHHH